MTKILKKLTEFFTTGYRSDLESFINSKRPTNASEVDYWVRRYNEKTMIKGL